MNRPPEELGIPLPDKQCGVGFQLLRMRIHIDLVRDRLQQSPQEDLPRAAQERG